jgi:predicted dehydrogenase
LEFRSSILEDREPAMSGQQGVNDLAVVLAAYRSIQEGREVALTLPKI